MAKADLRAYEPHIVGLCSFICRDVQVEVDAAGTQIKGREEETALTILRQVVMEEMQERIRQNKGTGANILSEFRR